jgi:hypothetical protein
VRLRERERQRERERERERKRALELEILGFEAILIILIALERFSYFVGRESSTFYVISRVIIRINPHIP